MYSLLALACMLSAATAAAIDSTRTIKDSLTATVPLTGVTHSVVAGLGGALRFDPDNVVAQRGDIVEWLFLPANHTVAQSSFAKPCVLLENGVSFSSGFKFATKEGLAPNVFQIVVEDDTTPIWYYCAQGKHCEMGMVGVINQNYNSPNTLAKHRELAAQVHKTVIPTVVGGKTLPNPNPGSGF